MPFEVRDLTVSLASGETIVEHVAFQIDQGEMLSIVGGSGAGKTTICKAIMSLLGSGYQSSGEILFRGSNLLLLPAKEQRKIYGKEICCIMQNPMTAFNPSVRVGRQIEETYLLHHKKTARTEIYSLIEATLHRLGLADTKRILKSYPFALSGGMLQRLMIATALINQPQLLIADEATTAIDACNRIELMKELRALCGEGMSILFVTHDMRAASFSDRLLIMNRGKAVESGKTERIMKCPSQEYTKFLLGASRLERRAADDPDTKS